MTLLIKVVVTILALFIISAVRCNLTSLTKLTIQCNLTSYENDKPSRNRIDSQPIHPTPAEALMAAITNHPTLVHLNLLGSTDCEGNGLKTITRQLANHNVKIQKIYMTAIFAYIVFPSKNTNENDKDERFDMEMERFGEDLVESVKSNFHLCDLLLGNIIFHDWWLNNLSHFVWPMPTMLEDRINFYTRLNKKGRRLLRYPNFSDVPPSLWCIILAGCGNVASLVYGLLHEITPNGNLLLVEIVGTERNRKRKHPETML